MDPVRANEIVAAHVARLALEPRHEFWRLRPLDGGALGLETTSAGLAAAAVAELERVGVRVSAALLPSAAAAAGIAWVAASVAEVRREPRHTAEQITQVVQGEIVIPLLHEDGWLLGRLADGYVGWIRDWHVVFTVPDAVTAYQQRTNARVAAACLRVRAAPRRDADAVTDTILGTTVCVHQTSRGWADVELPAGRRGWVPEAALREGTAPWPLTLDSLFAMLRGFLGVPYLWGGRSPKGFDCSGLVQFVYGLHGVALPRDSDEQAGAGAAADLPKPGDLVFFGRDRVTHVGIAIEDQAFLHARGHVRCNSLVEGTALHDAELRALWCGTRRVLPPAIQDIRG